MPAVVRGDEKDSVDSPDGTGDQCKSPTPQKTKECSTTVFVNGIGVVRDGDAMIKHNGSGCTEHAPKMQVKLNTKVFADGKLIAIVGDEYEDKHVTSSGSDNVNIGLSNAPDN